MSPLLRLEKDFRRLCKTERRTGEAIVKSAVARIGVGANPESTAISGTDLYRKKKDADVLGLFVVNGKRTGVFISMKDKLTDSLLKKQPRTLMPCLLAPFVSSDCDSCIKPERQCLHEIQPVAHSHIDMTLNRGRKLRKRLGNRKLHSERASVVVPVSARQHAKRRTTIAGYSHKPLRHFMDDAVTTDGKNGVVGSRSSRQIRRLSRRIRRSDVQRRERSPVCGGSVFQKRRCTCAIAVLRCRIHYGEGSSKMMHATCSSFNRTTAIPPLYERIAKPAKKPRR